MGGIKFDSGCNSQICIQIAELSKIGCSSITNVGMRPAGLILR